MRAEFPPLNGEEPPAPPGVVWNHTYIDWIDLKIGNQNFPPIPPEHTWTPGEVPKAGDPPGSPGAGHTLRFASTKFADGASAAIELKATFRVVCDNPSTTDEAEFSAILPLKVYNKAIGLTTVEVWFPGSPGHYSKPGDADYPDPASVPETAKRLVDDAIAKLTGSAMNHALVTGNGDGRTWRESTTGGPRLDEQMCLATLFFACTHGEISLWRASHTDELTYSPAYSNEVKTYVTSKPGSPRPPRDVPDHTLAFFYSCETLYNSSNNPLAFQIPHPTAVANKGYAGFTGYVDHRLFYPTTEFLDEHSKKVLDFMVLGEPLKKALDKVQDPNSPDRKYPMVRTFIGTGASLLMVIRGDPYARIVNVYLSETEWNAASAEVRNNWYWIKS